MSIGWLEQLWRTLVTAIMGPYQPDKTWLERRDERIEHQQPTYIVYPETPGPKARYTLSVQARDAFGRLRHVPVHLEGYRLEDVEEATTKQARAVWAARIFAGVIDAKLVLRRRIEEAEMDAKAAKLARDKEKP